LNSGSTQAEDELLEGHLCLTRELVSYLGPSTKFEVGSDSSKGINLIKVSVPGTPGQVRTELM
jgi:ubiquitin carboxyl-terminal hydrolase 9/24